MHCTETLRPKARFISFFTESLKSFDKSRVLFLFLASFSSDITVMCRTRREAILADSEVS